LRRKRPRRIDAEPARFCITNQCPLWVINGHLLMSLRCLLYPQKRTLRDEGCPRILVPIAPLLFVGDRLDHREIPSLGRGAQCGRRAAHSEAGDCQRVSPDGRRNDYGGAILADKCLVRWVLHAEHASWPALRRTIARVDFHPRGVAVRSR
jgi:hypothetical protein